MSGIHGLSTRFSLLLVRFDPRFSIFFGPGTTSFGPWIPRRENESNHLRNYELYSRNRWVHICNVVPYAQKNPYVLSFFCQPWKCHISEFEQTFFRQIDKNVWRNRNVSEMATFWRPCLFCDGDDLWLKWHFCHNLLIFDTIGWQVRHFPTSRVICHPIKYRGLRIYLFMKLCFQLFKLSPNVGVPPSRWVMMVRSAPNVRFAIDAVGLDARRCGRSIALGIRLDPAHLDWLTINLK